MLDSALSNLHALPYLCIAKTVEFDVIIHAHFTNKLIAGRWRK